LRIPVSHGHLEGNLRSATGPLRGGAVICHPHPQYGGTMHTKAVFRAAQALADVGFDVARFNFRGVGMSTGSYGGGEGEKEDVLAALDWMERERPGLPLLLGGFSFGATVGLPVGAADPRVKALLGLGLPLSMYDFSFLDGVGKPVLLVQGGDDEFGGGDALAALVGPMSGRIATRVVDGSDHYFNDHFEELQDVLREYFTRGPGANVFPGDGSESRPSERRGS
jgi:alpha/beta superfamily hydrolase